MGTLTITGSFNNCSCNYSSGSNIMIGNTITVTANDGYTFTELTETPNIVRMSSSGTGARTFAFTKNDDYSFSYTAEGSNAWIYRFNASDFVATKIPVTPKITIVVTGTFTNCTPNFNVTGETVETSFTPTITANQDHVFNSNFYVRNGRTGADEMMTLSADGSTLTYSLADYTDGSTVTFYSDYKASLIPAEELSDLVDIYFPTSQQLTSLGDVRFVDVSGNTVDRGEYIVKLYALPFDVANVTSEGSKNIVLGSYNSTVSSNYASTWRLEVDGGQISLNYEYNNVYDYLNLDIQLYAPYFGFIAINPQYVVGETISLTYLINLYNSQCTLCLKSTKCDNDVFHIETKEIGFEIPLRNSIMDKLVNQFTIDIVESQLNPFIIVESPIPLPVSNDLGKNSPSSGLIGDYTKWTVFSEVDLSKGEIPIEYQSQIENLLLNGVWL